MTVYVNPDVSYKLPGTLPSRSGTWDSFHLHARVSMLQDTCGEIYKPIVPVRINEDPMPFEIYLHALRRHWWVPLVAASVAALVGYLSQVNRPLTYEASTRVAITCAPLDYWCDQLSANWTQALEPYLHSANAVQTAVEKGYVHPDDSSLAYNVVTRSSRDNRIVTLALTDPDPVRAARIVGGLAHTAIEQLVISNANQANVDATRSARSQNAVQTQQLVISSLDCAAPTAGLVSVDFVPNCPPVPSTPNGPRAKMMTVAAGILGACLGLFVALGAGALDDTLKGEVDMQRYLRLPILGSIPGKRAGKVVFKMRKPASLSR